MPLFIVLSLGQTCVRYAEDCVIYRFILSKLHFILEERCGRSFHGSDVGPLLFLIYSYHIYICSNRLSFYKLFADTDLFYSETNQNSLETLVTLMFAFG